jgi:hypothetical protein
MRFVRGDEYQSVYMSHSRNLSIHERRRPTQRFEARALLTMPGRSCLIVGQVGERPAHNVTKISFDCGAPLACWETPTAIRQLVPDRRRNCALGAMLV